MRWPDFLPPVARTLLDDTFGEEWRHAGISRIEGTTNFVARLDLAAHSFALRVPRINDTNLQIDRFSECATARAAGEAGIGAEVVACEPFSGVLITRWIDAAVWSPAQAAQASHIEVLARLVGRLHRLPPPARLRELDLAANLRAQWTMLQTQAPELARMLAKLNDTALGLIERRIVTAPALCHNDLNCRNIIGDNAVRLLDWEYAAMSEPLFDLASYAQSHDLNELERQILLAEYGTADVERFTQECELFDWTCLLWMALVSSGTKETIPTANRARFDYLLARLGHAWR